MGTTLVQFQSCSVCDCLEPQPGFVTAKAALDSNRMKVSCSMVSPCNIIIMWWLIHDRLYKTFAHTNANFSCKLDWKINSGMLYEANRQIKMIIPFFYETFFYESVVQIFANKTIHWTSNFVCKICFDKSICIATKR